MSQSNRDIIEGVYAAFARGDIPAVLGAMQHADTLGLALATGRAALA